LHCCTANWQQKKKYKINNRKIYALKILHLNILGGIWPPFTYLPTPLQRGEMRARERGEEGSLGGFGEESGSREA